MTARYMLDTDTCSYIMKRSNPTVLKRLQAIPVTDTEFGRVKGLALENWTLAVRRSRSKDDE